MIDQAISFLAGIAVFALGLVAGALLVHRGFKVGKSVAFYEQHAGDDLEPEPVLADEDSMPFDSAEEAESRVEVSDDSV